MAEEKKEKKDCCGKKCEIFSRVCGYYSLLTNQTQAKQYEFHERVGFNVGHAVEQAKIR